MPKTKFPEEAYAAEINRLKGAMAAMELLSKIDRERADRLEAENASLKTENEKWEKFAVETNNIAVRKQLKNEKLEAENKRLRKALELAAKEILKTTDRHPVHYDENGKMVFCNEGLGNGWKCWLEYFTAKAGE